MEVRLERAFEAGGARLGFRYEGQFAQHMIVKGRNRDTTWFAMIDVDWLAQRDRLRTRLAAAA